MSALADAMKFSKSRRNKGIQILTVGEKGGVGFTYSYNHGNGRPEYYVADVPSDKAEAVARTINHLATIDDVGDRHSIRGYNSLLFWLHLVVGEERKRLLAEKCFFINHYSPGAPIYELRPCFDCKVTDPWWGGRPPLPNEQEDAIADQILVEWEKQQVFTLEVLCEVSELGEVFATAMDHLFSDWRSELDNVLLPRHKPVDLANALKRMDDWKVDWDKNLNDQQIQFVKDHTKYFRMLAKVMFRAKPICEYCGALENLKVCRGCKSTKYCSRECQLADWKSHKGLCKQYKAMRDSKLDDAPLQKVKNVFEN